MKIETYLGGVVFVLASCASAFAADLVVAEARGVGLRTGQMLDSAQPLVLKQGQHVTLISSTGMTFKLDGPYNMVPSADSAQAVGLTQKLAVLFTQRQAREEAGTARGGANVPLPDPWLLDIGHGGTVCIQEGGTPIFWRPDPAQDSTLRVTPADRSWNAESRWPAGQDRISVTTEVPMRGGAAYVISLDGIGVPVTLSTVPSVLLNDVMRAAWMAEKGCDAQAEALLRAVK